MQQHPALNFGEAGDTFAVCGENVPNIDGVVTDKELIFQYRRNGEKPYFERC